MKKLSCVLLLALLALGFSLTSCETYNDDSAGAGGFQASEPVRPVDRAANLQQQIGASNRSLF